MVRDIRVDSICCEAPGEWFVYLRPGWHLDGAHCFGEDTRAAISHTLKRVQPCECNECEVEKISAAIDEVLRLG